MTDGSTVLVTGASGYIALHVVQQLQQAGHKVRGTVRSLKNEVKVAPIREVCPGAKFPIELFEANLDSDEGWKEAVQGCEYVMHVASPFPNENPRNDDELIKPAVNGTLAVLKACREAGGVKRVVLTSSMAAVTDGRENGTFTEESWLDPQKTPLAYYKSKVLAERAAWDYVDNLPDDEKFELAVINPGYVMGPVLTKSWATSFEVVQRLLEHKMPAIPRCNVSMVDVRDVAAAHVNAMTVPEAAGKRHIVTSEGLWFKDMARVLNENFKPLGYKVPMKEAPLFLAKMMSIFDKPVKLIIPLWGKEAKMDNTRMKTVLGVEPRPSRDTIVQMAHSMIGSGFIKQTKKHKALSN